MNKISIAIAGYGNLGRGVEAAIKKSPDLELVAVLSRRDPASLEIATEGVPVISDKDAETLVGKVDVMIICGGSATDLPVMGPRFAKLFNTVDSFDTHAKIPEYFAALDSAARAAGNLSMLSVGWDPGMFSLNRLYAESILPEGNSLTFWGPGVSQGHSDAIRRIAGVKRGIQYTMPVENAIKMARNGEGAQLTAGEKHTRVCYVVAEAGADKEAIRKAIVTMPNYFADYDTTVNFIDDEEFLKNHAGMPHGGFVVRSGKTSDNKKHTIEYNLKLESNPEFTGSVLVAFARAVSRMAKHGMKGACTVFDVPPAYLSPKSSEQLRKELL